MTYISNKDCYFYIAQFIRGQSQEEALSQPRTEPRHFGYFYIAPYEQFISRLAKPRKEPNDQIFTFQAKLAVLTLRHMFISDIAPYEQFISGWPSLTLRHMNSLSAAGQAQKGAK